MDQVIYRYIRDEDVEQVVDVLARSRADLPFERRLTPSEFRGFVFGDPDFNREGITVACMGDEIVGMGSAHVEKARLDAGKNDGMIAVEVVPEHRGGAVERELVERALAGLNSRGIAKARARVDLMNTWQTSLVKSYSFSEQYRVYDLVRRGREPLPPNGSPEGVVLRRKLFKEFSDDEVRAANETLNDAFEDHFNSVPHSAEQIIKWREVFEDVMLVTIATAGEEQVGVSLTEESIKFNQQKGVKSGWIIMLGVKPGHRRRGIGKALLADGMRWLLERGMDTINISVLAENEKALDLYKSFGFAKFNEAIWYSRPTRMN